MPSPSKSAFSLRLSSAASLTFASTSLMRSTMWATLSPSSSSSSPAKTELVVAAGRILATAARFPAEESFASSQSRDDRIEPTLPASFSDPQRNLAASEENSIAHAETEAERTLAILSVTRGRSALAASRRHSSFQPSDSPPALDGVARGAAASDPSSAAAPPRSATTPSSAALLPPLLDPPRLRMEALALPASSNPPQHIPISPQASALTESLFVALNWTALSTTAPTSAPPSSLAARQAKAAANSRVEETEGATAATPLLEEAEKTARKAESTQRRTASATPSSTSPPSSPPPSTSSCRAFSISPRRAEAARFAPAPPPPPPRRSRSRWCESNFE
mmetsp:Transcript_30270/g.64247  ORF Transcript_30270/g.64247 Transcript_30270/m.64247 type:complete len:337 (-) Transcript_30270:165-1175(-)